mmetsp:Transcript_1762/g.4188  ORF Transcript_1762/g.4188 Transcript_1762/m.4188 type:complete len:288 (-) Transcript_1762:460-1323(-)
MCERAAKAARHNRAQRFAPGARQRGASRNRPRAPVLGERRRAHPRAGRHARRPGRPRGGGRHADARRAVERHDHDRVRCARRRRARRPRRAPTIDMHRARRLAPAARQRRVRVLAHLDSRLSRRHLAAEGGADGTAHERAVATATVANGDPATHDAANGAADVDKQRAVGAAVTFARHLSAQLGLVPQRLVRVLARGGGGVDRHRSQLVRAHRRRPRQCARRARHALVLLPAARVDGGARARHRRRAVGGGKRRAAAHRGLRAHRALRQRPVPQDKQRADRNLGRVS